MKIALSDWGDGIMRQIVTLSCATAFLILCEGTYVSVTQADPLVKFLLGGGLVFCIWLLILWKDLAQSEQEHATTERFQTPVTRSEN